VIGDREELIIVQRSMFEADRLSSDEAKGLRFKKGER